MALSGLLPANQLSTITGTTRQVRFDLLAQTNALRWAFEAHFGKSLVVTDGYRSYQSQVDVFTARYTQTYLVGRPFRTWNDSRWYQKPGTAVAAVPGTSNHGWAQALDLGSGVNSSLTSPEFKWMAANGPKYGYTHPAWAKQVGTLEPWHWEAVFVPASSYNGTSGPNPPTPIPPTPIPPVVEDDMYEQADRDQATRTESYAADARQYGIWANTNAGDASLAAKAGLDVSNQLLTLLRSVAGTDKVILQQCDALEVQIAEARNTLSRQIADVKARMALATRKQYSGLATEKTSYTAMEAQYATYEEMAGVRDPLKATVTVQSDPAPVVAAVTAAVQAETPKIVKGVNDDAKVRRSTWG